MDIENIMKRSKAKIINLDREGNGFNSNLRHLWLLAIVKISQSIG